MTTEFKAGDRVRILVGGPHENRDRIATVSYIQGNGDAVIYFGDQDEDEFVYSPNELEFAPTKFKIWYIHQVPGKPFECEVPDAKTGQLILDTIYDLALFQFENHMIPDYANSGGIVFLDEDGDWVDYEEGEE